MRLCVEGILECLPCERLVLLKLIRVEIETRAHGVEGRSAGVGRQRAHLYVNAEEIVQGVPVFAPIESAQGNVAALVAKGFPRLHHHLCEIGEEVGLERGRRRRLLLRWHFSRVHGVEDVLPPLRGRGIADDERQLVDPKFPLLLFWAVTRLAVLLEEHAMPRRHGRDWALGALNRKD